MKKSDDNRVYGATDAYWMLNCVARKLIGHNLFEGYYGNILNDCAQYLNEGLVNTYPFNLFLREVIRTIGMIVQGSKGVKYDDNDSMNYGWASSNNVDIRRISKLDGMFYIRIGNRRAEFDNYVKMLGTVCNACGYFIASFDEVKRIVAIESKFGKDITKDIKVKNDYIYHVSPKVYFNKIMKDGLCPKASNLVYEYPPRIYLATNLMLENAIKLATNLYQAKTKFFDADYGDTDEYKKYLSHHVDMKEYSILRIDAEKINGPLYADPNFQKDFGIDCLYTTSNISPDAITHIGDIAVKPLTCNDLMMRLFLGDN